MWKVALNQVQTNLQEIEHYDFDLPRELIAQHPLPNREDARLLVIDRERASWEHAHVRDIGNWIQPTDGLIFNETKVIPARLVGHREKTGGKWQGLYIESDPQGDWRVLCKTRGHLQPGEIIVLRDRDGAAREELIMVIQLDDGSWVVRPQDDKSPQQILEAVGHIPLPHYIRDGNMVDADVENYQTVYAKNPGSIAAPTAGLHFTKRLLQELEFNGVRSCFVTLHVGTGTFRPMTAANISAHQMHSEYGFIGPQAADLINQIAAGGGRRIAVGTTSVRLLESAAALGLPLQGWSGWTDLFIRPGFEFQVVDGLLTNFHLPRSTLLVLIRAFGGDGLMQAAYREAIENQYRFFSYGDAMLIL